MHLENGSLRSYIWEIRHGAVITLDNNSEINTKSGRKAVSNIHASVPVLLEGLSQHVRSELHGPGSQKNQCLKCAAKRVKSYLARRKPRMK
jgi:hypothetical protein